MRALCGHYADTMRADGSSGKTKVCDSITFGEFAFENQNKIDGSQSRSTENLDKRIYEHEQNINENEWEAKKYENQKEI